MCSKNSLAFRFLVISGTVLVLTGCSSIGCCLTTQIQGKNTTHFIVLGVGIISIPKAVNTGITATRTHALGAVASDQPGMRFGLGAISSSTLTVEKGAKDVRMEMSRDPTGDITTRVERNIFGQGEEHDKQ